MTSLHEADSAALRALRAPLQSLEWTKDTVATSIPRMSFAARVSAVVEAIEKAGMVVPDADGLARQLVTALDSGHVVLQGPPGTGKTTLARILADTYNCDLKVTTSTADWSTYDVIGGLRPTEDGSFAPALGVVSQAILSCAEGLRASPPRPSWLLIDEFNRADIDKAIGSMYTVLSSSSPTHLLVTPLELWFEKASRKNLWVPSAFRIIATMNDVDASYVNSLSQGLSRRFHFVSLNVAVEEEQIKEEVSAAFAGARRRWSELTGETAPDAEPAVGAALAASIYLLRKPDGLVRWPVGTAQITDVWFSLLVLTDGDASTSDLEALDSCFADTVVHQASNLSLSALDEMAKGLKSLGFSRSDRAVRHLADASSTRY